MGFDNIFYPTQYSKEVVHMNKNGDPILSFWYIFDYSVKSPGRQNKYIYKKKIHQKSKNLESGNMPPDGFCSEDDTFMNHCYHS